MKAKARNPLAGAIKNIDPRLVELLEDYEYATFETRFKSTGSDVLYIHMKRIHQPVKFGVKA